MSEDVVEVMVRGIASVDRQSSPEFFAQATLQALTEGGWEVRKVQDSSGEPETDRLKAEIADLKASVIAFCAPWATTYALERGLPPLHLFPSHYDLLKSCGARMVDFTRADLPNTIREGE